MIIEIMLVILCSSSVVERGFSAVRRQLRDQRVLMKHALLDESLRIKINMPVLRELFNNCESLVVSKAVERYHNNKKWQWEAKPPVSCKSDDAGASEDVDETDKDLSDEDDDTVSDGDSTGKESEEMEFETEELDC